MVFCVKLIHYAYPRQEFLRLEGEGKGNLPWDNKLFYHSYHTTGDSSVGRAEDCSGHSDP